MELKIIKTVHCPSIRAEVVLEACRTCRFHRFDGRGRDHCAYMQGRKKEHNHEKR